MIASQKPFASVGNDFSAVPGPIIIFNKSHSGSRLLARLVEESGVFMGAHQNESKDSLDMMELVNHLVCEYYPDYESLWGNRLMKQGKLHDLVLKVFSRHLDGFDPEGGGLWGWKLCETAYILPFLDFLFPDARFIHIIRDGRDVAFSDHTAPNSVFWRKIYFNTGSITTWFGLKMNARDYRKRSHVYNTIHWANSVMVGRSYGMMLREKYMEVRYEDLCLNFGGTAERVQDFIGVEERSEVIKKISQDVYTTSVGKHRHQPKRKVKEVVEAAKPLLFSLGYLGSDNR